MTGNAANGTYSAADVAFALQHGTFANYVREMTRVGALILPRQRTRGPGGGNYRFAHILELAFAITVGGARGRAIGRSVFWGLLNVLGDDAHALSVINALPDEERHAVILHKPDFDPDDYPEGVPHALAQVVEFPQFYFGSNFISRDPKKPTFFTFDPAPAPGAPAMGLLLSGDESLVSAHQHLLDLKLERAGSPATKEMYAEQVDDIPLVNLSTMLNRIEERLALRLKAREIRGA